MIRTICNFIMENGAEFLMLLATAGAIIVYLWQKRDTKRSAATLILWQVDSIENIVNKLKEEPQLDNIKVYHSKTIIKENMWERYKHLFARDLSSAEYRNVQNFFDVSEQIEMACKDILSMIHKAWDDRSLVKSHIMGTYVNEKINAFPNKTKEDLIGEMMQEKGALFCQIYDSLDIVFTPHLPPEVLIKSLSNLENLSRTTAYEKLQKYSFSK